MIGTTMEESLHDDKKVFKLHLFQEYAEDAEIIQELDKVLTKPVIKGKNDIVQPGFYKELREDGIVLLLVK